MDALENVFQSHGRVNVTYVERDLSAQDCDRLCPSGDLRLPPSTLSAQNAADPTHFSLESCIADEIGTGRRGPKVRYPVVA